MFAFGQVDMEAGRCENLKQVREAGQSKSQMGKVRGSVSYVLLQCVTGRASVCARRDLELP